jgi:UDP-GlcNAc:undecaprenyl-phosphate/decaprenyl-phosphate GlcNAc-1-phosphate transferase
MTLAFLLFATSFFGAVALTPVIIGLAHRWGALDQPGLRKVHDSPIPRLGGVAVVGTFSVISMAALLLSGGLRAGLMDNRDFWLSFGIGAALVFLLGLYDDIRHASVGIKFLVQFASAFLVIIAGHVRIETAASPFGGPVQLDWLGLPLTALWIVGVTNAFNLIDGLDGLAGGIAFISTATVFAVSLITGQRLLVVLVSVSLAGALLGFLRYNYHPAKIFLGDCGSMFLGYVLAVLSVVGAAKKVTALTLLIPILIVGIPVFETLYAMTRRLVAEVFVAKVWKPAAFLAMFRADQQHIHHKLMEMGYSHQWAVLIIYGLSVLLALFALVAALFQDDHISMLLVMAGFAAFFLIKHYGHYLPFVVGATDRSGKKDE